METVQVNEKLTFVEMSSMICYKQHALDKSLREFNYISKLIIALCEPSNICRKQAKISQSKTSYWVVQRKSWLLVRLLIQQNAN